MDISHQPNVRPVPLNKAYLLLNHGPVTLVSSQSEGSVNLMAAAWVMPLDFDPPKVAIVIDKQTRTRQLVESSGSFALNVPGRNQLTLTRQAGQLSALSQPEKWRELGCVAIKGAQPDTVLIDGCVAWLECRIIPQPAQQTQFDLFLAEVTHAWADQRQFRDARWHFDDPDRRTIHYVSGGQFFETGPAIQNTQAD